MIPRDMNRHVQALGIIYIAFSAVGLLAAVGMASLLSFLRTALGDSAGSGEITEVGRHALAAVTFFLIFISAPGMIGGIGLLKRREWARILVLILGFVNLMFVPFGTILGVYTIWALMKDETVRLFVGGAEQVLEPDGRAAVVNVRRDYRLRGLIWMTGAAAFAICVGVSIGTFKGLERALTVGVWGLIPLAVGVAMFLYGMTAEKGRRNSTGMSGRGGAGVRGILWLVLGSSVLASTASAYTHEETFQKSVPASGISKMIARNTNGDIKVEPWDRPEIRVEANKRVSASSQQAAEEFARKIEIAVEVKGGEVEIRTVMPGQKEDWDWVEGIFSFDWLFEGIARSRSVTYSISAPRKMDTDLKSTNGAVRVGAMEGTASLATTNGRVVAEGLRGNLTARSTNGAITLNGVTGFCDGATTNGKISVAFLTLSQDCKLRTTNGGIRVALPDSARADLDATIANGHISCELPISITGEHGRRRMQGRINGGGPRLELRTTNGSISVERGEGAQPWDFGGSGPSEKPLIAGVHPPPPKHPFPPSGKGEAHFIRIQVWDGGDMNAPKVKVTVPLALAEHALRSLPEEAREEIREKGIDIGGLLADIRDNPRLRRLVEIQDNEKRVQIDLVAE